MKYLFFIFLGALYALPMLSFSLIPEYDAIPDEEKTAEDRYIDYFGDDEAGHHYRMWSAMKKVYYDDHNETLLKLCDDVRKQAKKNWSEFEVKRAYIHPKILEFDSQKYNSLRVDVVTCEIEKTTNGSKVASAFHITEGRGDDCVYFLKPVHPGGTHYKLGELLWDVPIDDSEPIINDP